MPNRSKRIFLIPMVLLFVAWGGHSALKYFSHNEVPKITIKGIVELETYKGKIRCLLASDGAYKIGDINISIDGKKDEVIELSQIPNKNTIDLPFEINTNILSNGPHSLEVEVADSSYKKNKSFKKTGFVVDNIPLETSTINYSERIEQGKTLLIPLQANKPIANCWVSIFSKKYAFEPNPSNKDQYDCIVPIDCESQLGEHVFFTEAIDQAGNVSNSMGKIEVVEHKPTKQKHAINVSKKMALEKEKSISNKVFEDAIEKWLSNSPKEKLWAGPFEKPTLIQRISTPFGEIRTTPERGRYIHKGIDIVNMPNSVVWASQDGKVIIKDRYTLTGNTVVVDHGRKVHTIYAHLNDFADIEVGDTIRKGNPVGKIGMTGYATGYHLHWELRVDNMPVDPVEWTERTF
jgi:murein DD-endopeptidase MepM/ murein hydrolase activator NlpD